MTTNDLTRKPYTNPEAAYKLAANDSNRLIEHTIVDGVETTRELKIMQVRSKSTVVAPVAGGDKFTLPFTALTGLGIENEGKKYTVVVTDEQLVAPAAKAKRGPKREGETKLDKCRRLFNENRGKPKKDVVDLFISQAACTPMGANTYYLLINKQSQVAAGAPVPPTVQSLSSASTAEAGKPAAAEQAPEATV